MMPADRKSRNWRSCWPPASAYLRAIEAGQALRSKMRKAWSMRGLAADADQFLTLAKFRALRLLWARIEQACGLTPKPLFVAADTAWRMLTQRDAYVNMLRATMATFSAGLGGANAITVLPHTLALGLPDPFARRAARNTQLVLLEESNLAKVSDPAAGSGGIETLTRAALRSRMVAVSGDRKGRRHLRRARAEPDPAQGRRDPRRARGQYRQAKRRADAARANSRTCMRLRSPCSMRSRLCCAPYGEAKFKFDPLPPMRLAAPFEALRDKSDERLKTSGARPKIFLANLGTAADFTARATFAKSFSRPAASRRSTRKALPTRRRWPPRSRRPARLLCACARPTRSMRNTRWPPQRPFKPPAPSISIWQGGPANRRPRCAPPASAISSLPAATRWRCCRKPGGGWSEHDGRRPKTVLTGGCQCGAIRFAVSSAAGQDQHLPLPDVPEGIGRAVCLLRRHRARRLHLDPRQAGGVPILLHRRARFLRRPAARR